MTSRRPIALGWLAAALLAGLLLGGQAGLSAGEVSILEAGRAAAGLLTRAPLEPVTSARGLTALSERQRGPLLTEAVHGFAAEGGERIGLGAVRGARLGAAVAAALLAALVALVAFDLGGAPAALLAPALLFASPRGAAFALGLSRDLLGALFWLAAVAAFARSLEGETRLRRTRAGTWAGIMTGLAAAARPDLWTLVPLFACHWLLGRLHLAWLIRRAPRPLEEPPEEPPVDWATRLRRLPTGLAAAATVGPALAALATPWLWPDPLGRLWPALLSAHGAGQAAPVNPALLALAGLPGPVVLLFALGLGHSAQRLVRGLRHGDDRRARIGSLLLLAAGLPLALAALGLAPRQPGLGPIAPALPVLAVLGARALTAAAAVAWPARPRALAAGLAALLLAPGVRAAIGSFPHGRSAYGEPADGAPGAASRGWPRQEGGEAAVALLAELGRHAVPGARVAWIGVPAGAVERYRRAGLLRADLLDAPDASAADLAVVALETGRRDEEFAAWQELGSSHAEAGVYLDEVALAQLFARPGSWR